VIPHYFLSFFFYKKKIKLKLETTLPRRQNDKKLYF